MSVEIKEFGALPDGRTAHAYTLRGTGNLELTASDYGCRILHLMAPDRNGVPGDILLGHNTLEGYLGANYQGAMIGRVGNRIGGASFALEGKEYQLAKNDGDNSLHGGPGGFHQALWQAEIKDGGEPEIIFTLESPDGEEGFPGNIRVQVSYQLKADNVLDITYRAATDRLTLFNPTNHSFFNLSGDPEKDVLGTYLSINASQYTAVGDDLITTGELLPVEGGPLDFRSPKKLGEHMFCDDHLIRLCGGFDHNFCPDGTGYRKIAEACEPDSGRTMEVFTDMPGVQLYTFNRPDEGLIGRNGKQMGPHTAFCLETQFYPDTVHHQNFPGGYLRPEEEFVSRTSYKFSVK